MKDRLLSTLGICRKAGKLLWGFDMVAEALKKQEAQLVFLTGDLSPKSAKEVKFLCSKYNVRVIEIPVTMDEVRHRLGKRSGILAVTDRGLANTLQSTAGRTNEEE